jgi:hypothetical protein
MFIGSVQRKKIVVHLFITTIFCFLACNVAPAAEIIVKWEPNDPAPEGYNVYHRKEGEAYDYNQPVWTGSDDSAIVTILAENGIHYFTVSAFDQHVEGENSKEVYLIFNNSLDHDDDDDGIVNVDEIGIYKTDPYNSDTDGDGLQDGTEVGLTLDDVGPDTDLSFFIPDADPSSTTFPTVGDTDGDGMEDGEEDSNQNGKTDRNETNPTLAEMNLEQATSPGIAHIVTLLLSD